MKTVNTDKLVDFSTKITKTFINRALPQ